MGMLDDAKDKLKQAKDRTVKKLHEQKGRMKERHDQAKEDDHKDDPAYDREEEFRN